MLHDRLPTKSNLVTRGVVSSEARLCVAACGHVKDATHLLLSCTITARFFNNFILYVFNMCLYMLVCDYLSLGVFSWVFVLEGYFGLLVNKGNLVIP